MLVSYTLFSFIPLHILFFFVRFTFLHFLFRQNLG